MAPGEREQVAEQLGQRFQNERSPVMKLVVIQTLGKFETPMAETALRMALSDPDAQIRRAAVEAWGVRRGEPAIQALSQTLSSDTDLDVRLAAARELGNFQDRTAIEARDRAGRSRPGHAIPRRAIVCAPRRAKTTAATWQPGGKWPKASSRPTSNAAPSRNSFGNYSNA